MICHTWCWVRSHHKEIHPEMLWPKDCLMLSHKFHRICNGFHDSGQWGKSVFNMDAKQEASSFSKHYKTQLLFLYYDQNHRLGNIEMQEIDRQEANMPHKHKQKSISQQKWYQCETEKTEEVGRKQRNTHKTRMEKNCPNNSGLS